MDVNLHTIAMRLLRQLLEAPASHVRQRQTVLQPRFLSPRRAVIRLVLMEEFQSAVTVAASFRKRAPHVVRYVTIMATNVVQTRAVVHLPVAVAVAAAVAVAVAVAAAVRPRQVAEPPPPLPLTIPATMMTATLTV